MTKLEQIQKRATEKFKEIHADMFKGRVSPLYVDKQLEQLITEVWNEAIKECEGKYKNEIGGFIAGAYALRFDESSREVECWDMWKAGYEQCRKDALNAITYESRRQN